MNEIELVMLRASVGLFVKTGLFYAMELNHRLQQDIGKLKGEAIGELETPIGILFLDRQIQLYEETRKALGELVKLPDNELLERLGILGLIVRAAEGHKVN